MEATAGWVPPPSGVIIKIEGSRAAVARFLDLFPIPEPTPLGA
jgi:hypothetical protein